MPSLSVSAANDGVTRSADAAVTVSKNKRARLSDAATPKVKLRMFTPKMLGRAEFDARRNGRPSSAK
jgi:hypothetical protein